MRTKNSARNIVFSLILQVIMLICGLIFPRQIILNYGSNINGLTQTINQIITYLNLLQAGAIGASVFALYRPVAEEDFDTINSILCSTKKYYNKIGFVFCICFSAITFIFAYFKQSDELEFYQIVLACLLLGVNGAFSFYIYSWFDTLFQSYQQQYIFTIGQIFERIVYYVLLILILKFHQNFMLMYVALLIGAISRIVFLFIMFKKYYNNNIFYTYNKKTIIIDIPNKGFLFVNQVAIQLIECAPTLLLSFVFGLKYVSVFSIYYMVFSILKMLINIVYSSINTSFANYAITHNSNETKNLFDCISYVFVIVTSFFSFCCGALLLKFVDIYTIGIIDVNYHVPLWAFSGACLVASYGFYIPYYMLTNTYGLFKEMALPSFCVSLILVVASIVIATVFNYTYFVFAPTLYYIIMGIYRLSLAKKKINWFNKISYLRMLLLIIALICGYLTNTLVDILVTNWVAWLVASICIMLVCILFVLLYSLLFEFNKFKRIVGYLVVILKKEK